MPRSKVKASPHLEILLDNDRAAWAGGDIIVGRVSRCAPVVSSQATMRIRLLGRAKSLMVVNRGQAGTSMYRNRYNFFTPEQTCVELLNGPIHIPETDDMYSWRFSLQIPDQLNPEAVAMKNQQKFSYLPLGHDQILATPMPPSFYTKGVWFHINYEAYNEYFLQAELNIESGGSVKTATATLPINVLHRSTPSAIADFPSTRLTSLCTLSSHRLLPGSEKSSLTLQQRTQHLFKSSKVPQYSFMLQVDCPRVLQIGNSTPIPFKLLAIREPSHTTDVIQDHDPELTLTSIQLEVKSSTEIMCRGTLSYHDVKGSRKIRLLNNDTLTKLESPIVVPSSAKAEAVDVGQALGITLTHAGVDLESDSSTRLAQSLFPTFNTYNIQHSHTLLWKVEISSAGTSTKISDEVDLTLLPLLATSDAPPYTPLKEVPDKPAPYTEEAIPTYAEAVPSSSKTDDLVGEKTKLKGKE